MKEKNPLLLSINQSFVAGSGNLNLPCHRLHKLNCAAVLFCRNGSAKLTINSQEYDVVKNTQIVLLMGAVVTLQEKSDDFAISYFGASVSLFREASLRMDLSFFHFLRKHPCCALPREFTYAVKGLMGAVEGIHADRENRFRNQIARNHLQNFLLDVYDKVYRAVSMPEPERRSRQDVIFHKFLSLIHDGCACEREVLYYADKLCISTKYLTNICRKITGNSAKQTIDSFAILEIKLLLQSTELNIQEIADKLDFPDQSYLGRYFKRHEGVSPIKYRHTQKG